LFTLHVRLVAEDAESGEDPSRCFIRRLQCREFEAFLRRRLGREFDEDVFPLKLSGDETEAAG